MSSMSGDDEDDGQQEVSQEHLTKAIDNDDNGSRQGGTSDIDVGSGSEDESTASSTVRETEVAGLRAKPKTRRNESPLGQSARQAISRDWEDASDSVPDDLPSVNVSVLIEAMLNWL